MFHSYNTRGHVMMSLIFQKTVLLGTTWGIELFCDFLSAYKATNRTNSVSFIKTHNKEILYIFNLVVDFDML